MQMRTARPLELGFESALLLAMPMPMPMPMLPCTVYLLPVNMSMGGCVEVVVIGQASSDFANAAGNGRSSYILPINAACIAGTVLDAGP
jgi:hypothetical protein